jgi:hypothetical protein
LRYSLSYRDLEEMMRERVLSVDHTTIYRWVQAYAPELVKRIRPHLRLINDSYRVDETYVKVKGAWKYLYRTVDSTGQTIDFMLSAKRDIRPPNNLRDRSDRERKSAVVASIQPAYRPRPVIQARTVLSCRLFGVQHNYRIDLRRSPRRNQTGDERDERQQ